MSSKIIAISIFATDWMDRYGNTQFSGVVVINTTQGQETIKFKGHGYGNWYEYHVLNFMKNTGRIKASWNGSLSRWCDEKKIQYFSTKIMVNRKKDLYK